MIRKILGVFAFVFALSPAFAADNYNATPGSGLLVAAKDASGTGAGPYFPRVIGCDNTTTTQCWTVDASGRLTALAVQSGTWNITNISGTVSLPTGASTAANQTNVQTPLAPGAATATAGILAGGVFNTTQPTFTNTQQGAAQLSSRGEMLVAPGVSGFNVTNAGTFAVQLSGATNNINNISGTISLPTGASTSANQSTEITAFTGTSGTTAHGCSVAGYGMLGCLGQIDDDVKGAVAAGTNTIGNVGFDPSQGKGTPTSVAINVSTATTTQLVAISGSTKIYVTSFDVIAGGTGNITFEYGTGVNCGTGTTALTGAYNLTAQVGISKGSGVGPVLIVPAGNALCVLTTAAVQMSGSVSYQQF